MQTAGQTAAKGSTYCRLTVFRVCNLTDSAPIHNSLRKQLSCRLFFLLLYCIEVCRQLPLLILFLLMNDTQVRQLPGQHCQIIQSGPCPTCSPC